MEPTTNTVQANQQGALTTSIMNGINLGRGQTYAVGLFMSGWKANSNGTSVQTALVCSTSFTG